MAWINWPFHRLIATFADATGISGVIRYSWALIKSLTITQAKSIATVVRSEDVQPWSGPSGSEFTPGTRVIWAYWDSGESNLKPFFKLCVASWRAKNPDWHIAILSDDNFKQYVSRDQIPSTYFSLKRQHRSDILRLAVLIRYGGVYMDISTLCLKGFDAIFDNPETPALLMTAPFKTSKGLQLANNAILISPEPKNPLLVSWHKAILQYQENPAKTGREMLDRPEFNLVRDEVFYDPWTQMGLFHRMPLYLSNLYLLINSLLSDMRQYAKEHVGILPTDRWTVENFVMMPEVPLKTTALTTVVLLRMVWDYQRLSFQNDVHIAEEVCNRGCIMKSSSDICWQASWSEADLLALDTTYGHILKYALDDTKVEQATLEGMTTVEPAEQESVLCN